MRSRRVLGADRGDIRELSDDPVGDIGIQRDDPHRACRRRRRHRHVGQPETTGQAGRVRCRRSARGRSARCGVPEPASPCRVRTAVASTSQRCTRYRHSGTTPTNTTMPSTVTAPARACTHMSRESMANHTIWPRPERNHGIAAPRAHTNGALRARRIGGVDQVHDFSRRRHWVTLIYIFRRTTAAFASSVFYLFIFLNYFNGPTCHRSPTNSSPRTPQRHRSASRRIVATIPHPPPTTKLTGDCKTGR